MWRDDVSVALRAGIRGDVQHVKVVTEVVIEWGLNVFVIEGIGLREELLLNDRREWRNIQGVRDYVPNK